jgi:flagellar biosynthesis protein FlhG
MLHNAMEDQAAGLRKMLGKPETQMFVVLSAINPVKKNNVLLNLASAFISHGNSIHLLDTRIDKKGISSRTPQQIDLWDLALKSLALHQGYYEFTQGGRISKLSTKPTALIMQQKTEHLSNVISHLSTESNIWLIDSDLSQDNPFLLSEFSDSHIILLVSNTAQSIKYGYSYLKHISNTLGRRKVSLLVIDSDEEQAQLIHKNIKSAATQFLSTQVNYLGSIPQDEHLGLAAQLGKAIIEAFPSAKASYALKSMVSHLLDSKMTDTVLPRTTQLNHLVLEH